MKIQSSVLAAGLAVAFVGGCASPQDAGDTVAGTPIPVGSDAGGGDAAGIQLAQPSGAPDGSDVAKRRAPEAVGTVISMTFGEDSVQVEFAPDEGYEYFEGTAFDIPFSAVAAVDGETPLVLGDLKAGDRINVWTGPCAESMPVQCEVQAVTAAQ
jgi:hypothetical protein